MGDSEEDDPTYVEPVSPSVWYEQEDDTMNTPINTRNDDQARDDPVSQADEGAAAPTDTASKDTTSNHQKRKRIEDDDEELPSPKTVKEILNRYTNSIPPEIATMIQAANEKEKNVVGVPECSICMENCKLPTSLHPCVHPFCLKCIVVFVNSQTTTQTKCPLCRKTITTLGLPVPHVPSMMLCHPNGKIDSRLEEYKELFVNAVNIHFRKPNGTMPPTMTIGVFTKIAKATKDKARMDKVTEASERIKALWHKVRSAQYMYEKAKEEYTKEKVRMRELKEKLFQ